MQQRAPLLQLLSTGLRDGARCRSGAQDDAERDGGEGAAEVAEGGGAAAAAAAPVADAAAEAAEPATDQWVQCDRCRTWRIVPDAAWPSVEADPRDVRAPALPYPLQPPASHTAARRSPFTLLLFDSRFPLRNRVGSPAETQTPGGGAAQGAHFLKARFVHLLCATSKRSCCCAGCAGRSLAHFNGC